MPPKVLPRYIGTGTFEQSTRFIDFFIEGVLRHDEIHVVSDIAGSCHKRQIPQAPTPQEPVRNRETRKVANAKGFNRNTNLT